MYSFLASGVLVAVWALLSQSSCSEQGLVSSCSAQASHFGDFSCCAQSRGLGHAGFSTCGTWLSSCSSQGL